MSLKLILLSLCLLQLSNLIACTAEPLGLLRNLVKSDETVLKFNYQNCGPPTDPLNVEALSVSPDPIHFPGTVNISAAVSLATNLSSPLTVSLKIEKKVGPFVVNIPCVDNVGSCTYNDICQMLPPNPDQCPDFFKKNNLPCDCPFPSGNYGVQNLVLQINVKEPVPTGQYQITADISSGTTHIGCLYVVANYQ